MASAIFCIRDCWQCGAQDVGEGGAFLSGPDGDADAAVERRRAGHADEDIAGGESGEQGTGALGSANINAHEVGG
jgi:hypothetical protein